MPRNTKLSTYVRKTGTRSCNADTCALSGLPCGFLSSSTMIVIRIAITPSLNAWTRSFSTEPTLRVEYGEVFEVELEPDDLPVPDARLVGEAEALRHHSHQ